MHIAHINNPSTPYGSATRTFRTNGIVIQTDSDVTNEFIERCIRISQRGIAQSGYINGVCWRIVR